MFDIKGFYPSIKEAWLNEALEFAKQHVTIEVKGSVTIFHTRKSLLYSEWKSWIKKPSNYFDFTVES